MERQDDRIVETAEEARAGETRGVMRWVLAISVLLAIAALSFIWIFGTGL